MPHLDPEKRRETWRRWAKKNRHKVRYKDNARRVAEYTYPKAQACSIKGCAILGERHHSDYSKPKDIVWLCKLHHELLHHREVKLCSMDGCDRKHVAKGMCHLHYYRANPWRK